MKNVSLSAKIRTEVLIARENKGVFATLFYNLNKKADSPVGENRLKPLIRS